MRRIVVDGVDYFWRVVGTDDGISVDVVGEEGFKRGVTGQSLHFVVPYDPVPAPTESGWHLVQRGVVSPRLIRRAIAVARRGGSLNALTRKQVDEVLIRTPEEELALDVECALRILKKLPNDPQKIDLLMGVMVPWASSAGSMARSACPRS